MSDDIEQDIFDAKIEAVAAKRVADILRDPEQLRDILSRTISQLSEVRSELNAVKPKIEFAETVMQSKDWSDMASVAKLIGYKGRGRNTIFDILRERKILRHNNEPYQRYVEPGYFKVVEQHWENPKTGETMVRKKTVVSQRGIDFIRRILNEVYE
jgi:anti-repressor protein